MNRNTSKKSIITPNTMIQCESVSKRNKIHLVNIKHDPSPSVSRHYYYSIRDVERNEDFRKLVELVSTYFDLTYNELCKKHDSLSAQFMIGIAIEDINKKFFDVAKGRAKSYVETFERHKGDIDITRFF